MTLNKQIIHLSEAFYDEIVSIRRHIHKHPELSFQEFETSKFIQEKLDEYGIPYKSGYVKTGIVARIDGEKPGKTVALRADMDALPIQEQSSARYCSLNKGVMHACGHDVHIACLLGTAKLLRSLQDQFEGTVLLLFQPAEEKTPGGAKLMLEEGIFEGQQPDAMVALHVFPDEPAGKTGFRPGIYMASGDEIYFTVKGRGGHAALRHKIIDTVLTAARIITSLQGVITRNTPPNIPTVLSFGKVEANGSTNIIPDEVNVAGTFRTIDEGWRSEAKKLIRKTACSVAEEMGAQCEINIEHGYPMLYNDEQVTATARQAASEILGEQNIFELDIRMTCEDFAYYAQHYPATFFRLGVKPAGKEPLALHTPYFDIDEAALKTGTQTMCAIAIKLLR